MGGRGTIWRSKLSRTATYLRLPLLTFIYTKTCLIFTSIRLDGFSLKYNMNTIHIWVIMTFLLDLDYGDFIELLLMSIPIYRSCYLHNMEIGGNCLGLNIFHIIAKRNAKTNKVSSLCYYIAKLLIFEKIWRR